MSFVIHPIIILSLLLTLLLSPNVRAQQTFFPAAVPLAVRSPYLTNWDYLTNGSVLGQSWPVNFDSQVCRPHIFGFS